MTVREPGTVVSRYRLGEPLPGRPGELSLPLYRGEAIDTGDTVVISLLDRHVDGSELEQVDRIRLIESAEAFAGIGHPCFAPLRDVEPASADLPLLCWSLRAGEPLRQRLERRALDVDDALSTLRDLASGLAAAHRAGLVHGALRPAVLFLGEQGGVQCLAAGVETAMAEILDESGRGPGTVLVTATYCAPEQLAQSPRTLPASDLYAIGVLLYELLNLAPPFQARTAMGLAQQIAESEPPPLFGGVTEASLLADELERLVTGTLARDPASRFASAQELVDAIDDALVSPALAASGAAPIDFEREAAPALPARHPARPAEPPSSSARRTLQTWRREQQREPATSALKLSILPGILLLLLIVVALRAC